MDVDLVSLAMQLGRSRRTATIKSRNCHITDMTSSFCDCQNRVMKRNMLVASVFAFVRMPGGTGLLLVQ
jgi:hypothetical protein